MQAAATGTSTVPLWYLYTSVISLALFCSGLVALVPDAVESTLAPHVLALIHVATLGVLTTAIMGALWQLLPVILVVPAPRTRVSNVHYLAWLAGVATLITGFWQSWWQALAVGGAVVVLAVLVFAAAMLWLIAKAPTRSPSVYYIATGLLYLLAVVVGGLALVVDEQTGLLGSHTFNVLPAHLMLGFVGWGVQIVFGVSYKLAPMFSLAHVHDERPGWLCFGMLNGGLISLAVGLLAGWLTPVCLVPFGLILAAIIVFALDLLRILRTRVKRTFDPTQFHGLAGLAFLLAAGSTGVCYAVTGSSYWWLDGRAATVLGLMVLLGFLAQTIVGYAYKIVPFLVWNQRYAPLIGKAKVPMMHDLISKRLAWITLGLYNGGLILLLAAVLWDQSLITAASIPLAASSWIFAANLVAVFRPIVKGTSHEQRHGV